MSSTVVNTSSGQVQGIQEDRVYAWKGIPYAKPPVGKLRFRPPQPVEYSNCMIDATKYKAIPYQPAAGLKKQGISFTMSEDCLHLNIWSPGDDQKRRPVMVWIYGGSFIGGSGNFPLSEGTSFVENGNVVFVTFNYRVGPLGFLHLGGIGQDEHADSFNCGILDQVAALRWVKENIAQFGGDPEQVTIFGQSAGGGSVGTLLAMPSSKGLFQRAILQSGAAFFMGDKEQEVKKTDEILQELQIATEDYTTLFKLPADQVSTEVLELFQKKEFRFLPVIDGESLPQHPLQAIEAGYAKEIPLLMGSTLNEMALMYISHPDWYKSFTDPQSCIQWFQKKFGPFPPEVLAYYLEREHPQQPVEQKLISMLGDRNFLIPALQFAERQLSHGTPVWMYRFDWQSQAMGGVIGACHSVENPFVFNRLDVPSALQLTGDNPDVQLAENVHAAWTAFARTGDPNIDELPTWSPYELNERPTMVFDSHSKLIHDPSYAERKIWDYR